MIKVNEIERAVRDLSPEDLRQFRRWFLDFEAQLWDRQIELDAESGRLDALAEDALTELHEGHSRPL